MKNLWRALKLVLPHRGMLFWYTLTAIGLAIFGSAPLVLVKTFLNKIQGEAPTDGLGVFVDSHLAELGGHREYIYGLCGLTLVLWVGKAVCEFLNTYIASWLAQSLRMEAMQRVMNKLLTLDQPWFDRQKIGDLVTRMVSDGDTLRKTVKIFLDFFQQPFKIVALVALAISYDWFLFCVGAIGLPVVVYPLRQIIRNITRHAKRYQEKTADLSQAMLQNLSGMRIIHAYDAAEKESKSFAALAMSLFRTGMKRNWSRAMQRPFTELVMGFGIVGVMWVGGIRLLETPNADPARFVAFIMALGMLYEPVKSMMSTLGELAEFLPSAERTFEVLDIKPTIAELPGATVCPTLKGTIVFENVCFDYGRGEVLKNLNLTIRAGEKIGIVGATGTGKSTLLSLLLRFYDPTSGRVLIDGTDIRSVTLSSLRVQMALVNQSPFLFHASVADNIRYGRAGATDDEVHAAAMMAMIHDEILKQPEGYETLCGERGSLFSGGQCQRIAVARAILRNAPILLLDEATSALDNFSERRVQEAIDKLVVSRTSLIVAHRLTTLRNVDRIVVLGPHGTGGPEGERGCIEAIGTHAELLESSPTYRMLWREQNAGSDESGMRASGQ